MFRRFKKLSYAIKTWRFWGSRLLEFYLGFSCGGFSLFGRLVQPKKRCIFPIKDHAGAVVLGFRPPLAAVNRVVLVTTDRCLGLRSKKC